MELLLCTWYCVKFFTWIVSFDTLTDEKFEALAGKVTPPR